ncbi:helix-turn-helix domain-containing protein [Nonomuraea angiospora]
MKRNGEARVVADGQSPVGSVDRALLILQEIGKHGRGVTLDELATRLGLPKSSLTGCWGP